MTYLKIPPIARFWIDLSEKNNNRLNSTIQLLAEFTYRHPTFRFQRPKNAASQEKIYQPNPNLRSTYAKTTQKPRSIERQAG